MNILIITTRVPYPPYRGDKLKIFNIARQLSKNNSVTILTLLRSKSQIKEIEELKKHNFNVIFVKISFIESCLNIIKAIFSNIPFQVAWYSSQLMQTETSKLISSGSYDVTYFHLIRSAQYLPRLDNTNSVLNVIDFTDAVSLYLDRFTKIEKNPVKRLLLKIEKRRVETYEKIAEKFHIVFICSEVDRDYLIKREIKANIKILRNGVDVDYFKAEDVKREEKRIIFTGNMPYYANYDAAIYFSNEIFPLILREIPDAKFYIVGQKPPYRIKALASENIIVTGYVRDIRIEYLKSSVNVAPMRFGAGTLNKIIESVVLGVPVVASQIAVDGLPDEIKRTIIVAKDSVDFANQVIKIISRHEFQNSSSEKEKQALIESLSWENIVKKFETDLKHELPKLKSSNNF